MIDLAHLFATAAELFDVSDGALADGRGRTARLVEARQAIAWVLARRRYTTVEIGALLKRDHSTICYSLKMAERRAASDPAYAGQLVRLLASTRERQAPPRVVAETVAARVTPQGTPLRMALTFWGISTPIAA